MKNSVVCLPSENTFSIDFKGETTFNNRGGRETKMNHGSQLAEEDSKFLIAFWSKKTYKFKKETERHT